MSIKTLRLPASIALCLALLSGSAIAGAATPVKQLDYLQIIAGSAITGKVPVDVKGELPIDQVYPVTVEVKAPIFFTAKKAYTFDAASPTKTTKVDYTIKKGKTVNTYSITIDSKRAFGMSFKSDPLTVSSTGHIVYGMAWTPSYDVKRMAILTPAPDNNTGIGKNISLLGQNAEGKNLYGTIFTDAKAGKQKLVQMAFINNAKIASESTSSTAKSGKNSMNTYLIIATGVLLAIAIGILIYVLVKGNHSPDDSSLDYILDDETDEDEIDESGPSETTQSDE